MQINADSPEEYIEKIPEERKVVFRNLRNAILDHLPDGFAESICYGMIGYVVPHSLYPAGYHCDPKQPLPFMNIASQKHFVAVYHMGIYVLPDLMDWFVSEYPKYCSRKLDMGKSCIRFKKIDEIPIDLIGDLASKITVEDWINIYEEQVKR